MLPILPAGEGVLFPGVARTLSISRPRLLALVEDALRDGQPIGVLAQKVPGAADTGPGGLFDVGVMARIGRIEPNPQGGGCTVELQGIGRFQVIEYLSDGAYLRARVRSLDVRAAARRSPHERRAARLRALGESVLRAEAGSADLANRVLATPDPGQLADLMAANLGLGLPEQQAVLEAAEPGRRLDVVTELVKRKRADLGRRVRPTANFLSFLLIAAVLGLYLDVARIPWKAPLGAALYLSEAVAVLGVLREAIRSLR